MSYELDANGDPIVATRRAFVTSLAGAEGATIDPVTGDFLFSTFGASNRVVRGSGFAAQVVPEPATVALTAGGLALLGVGARRRQQTA